MARLVSRASRASRTCLAGFLLIALPLARDRHSSTWVPAVAMRATGEWGRSATAEELEQSVPTLYVYDHCPFCVRARMIFGLKKTPFKLDFLMNDDVVTPTKMIGKKVLPIMEMDGEAMGESLDIVAKVDALDDSPILAKASGREDISKWLSDNKDLLRKITRPRDAMALYPEFSTKAARATWVKNHQLSGTTYEEALASSEDLLEERSGQMQ